MSALGLAGWALLGTIQEIKMDSIYFVVDMYNAQSPCLTCLKPSSYFLRKEYGGGCCAIDLMH